MRTIHGAASYVERRCQPTIDLQLRAADSAADKIDNGIHGANLVEMHLLDRHGMNACFRFAEQLERARCSLLYRLS